MLRTQETILLAVTVAVTQTTFSHFALAQDPGSQRQERYYFDEQEEEFLEPWDVKRKLRRIKEGEYVERGWFGRLKGIGITLDMKGDRNLWANPNVEVDPGQEIANKYGDTFGSVGSLTLHGEDGRIDLRFSSELLTRAVESGQTSGTVTNTATGEKVPVNFLEVNSFSCDYEKFPQYGQSGPFLKAGIKYSEFTTEGSKYGAKNQFQGLRDIYDFQSLSEPLKEDNELSCYMNVGYEAAFLGGYCVLRPQAGLEGTTLESSDNSNVRYDVEMILRTRTQSQIPESKFYVEAYAGLGGKQYFSSENDTFARLGARLGIPVGGHCRFDLGLEASKALSLNDDLYSPVSDSFSGVRDENTRLGATFGMVLFW